MKLMDKEKIIKGIDICLQRFRCGEDCPYYNYEKIGCMEQLREDALALLKEQEDEYENGFNDAMLGKHELMYEGTDGKWYKKDW